MQHEPEPDRTVAVADPAEENARAYGGERLGHWLLKMDHAVRHSHYQYRVNTKRRFKAVNQKASEEKFEPEKLKEIDEFPNKKRNAEIRVAVVDLEKRVFARKTAGERHQVNERQHDRNANNEQLQKAGLDLMGDP